VQIDEGALIVTQEQAQEVLGLQGQVHQIALRMDDSVDLLNLEAMDSVLDPLRNPSVEVTSWIQTSAVMATLIDVQYIMLFAMVGVIFLVIGFGIVNTLSMSLLERTHEFGVLRAIGTDGTRLAGLILTEAASLGVVGAAAGFGLYLVLHLILAQTGVPMGGVQMEGMMLDRSLYPLWDPVTMFGMPPIFILMTAIVGLTTAVRAARIRPVEALREL
jgi:ABC-type lipoprotein release transport system permease subunit